MRHNFYSQVKAKPLPDIKLLGKLLAGAGKLLKISKESEITILLVGDGKIRKLNKEYRHKDKVTDVLSFSQQEGLALQPASRSAYLGDIIISYPQVKRQAKKFGLSPQKELAFLIIHGLLHLLGYQDKTIKQYTIMENIQNKILSKFYD